MLDYDKTEGSIVPNCSYAVACGLENEVCARTSHRSALVDAGLTRHDIGDIASKIGQLYYNFYLKTSNCSW